MSFIKELRKEDIHI